MRFTERLTNKMNEVRISSCATGDRATYALVGILALVLLGAGIAHEVEKPESGLFGTVVTVFVLLGSAFLCFGWATASVGVSDDHIVQYYFGRSFRSVNFDEVENAEVHHWGRSFRGFVTGCGPYCSLTLRKKNGTVVGFDGLRSSAEPAYQRIAERFSQKMRNQSAHPKRAQSQH